MLDTPRATARVVVLAWAALLLGSLGSAQHAAPWGKAPGLAPPRTVGPEVLVRIAMIGDFGLSSPEEAAVAARVHALAPELVFTLGDNNYPSGGAATIDANIGQYYHDYIAPYLGTYGPGAATNRFFPALGNHDWLTAGATPYLDYFSLPGNERTYDVRHGPVHVFVLDSDASEPDGITAGSLQAQWLESALRASVAPFKFVVLHHAPYSSCDNHGPNLRLQWPFAKWGADAVFAGHDHVYERLDIDGIVYCVNGLGGNPTRYFFELDPIAGSRRRERSTYGAQIVDADSTCALLRFVSEAGYVLDETRLFSPELAARPEFLVARDDPWRFLDTGANPGASWVTLGFDDSGWGTGAGHFGYGDGDEDTLVDFGPDPNDKYITTFFRRVFTVGAPASISELSLQLLRDDGAVAYLNGVEVVRTNMPAGPVNPATTASAVVAGNPEDSLYEHALNPALLLPGANVLAVEIHQSSGNSSDISFAANLQAHRGSQVLVPAGSTWAYLDTGVDPGPSWIEPGFDDSAWPMGPAELGYGDGGDEATVLQYGPDPNDRYVTTYFRHEFVVANAFEWKALLLRLQRDDGAAVYLNGTEVQRFNLPLAGFDGTTLAEVDINGDSAEGDLYETRIDRRVLRNGLNVLAVEMHQSAPDSPDLSFDLELLGRH